MDCREYETKQFESLEACVLEIRRREPAAKAKGNRVMWCNRNLKLDKYESITRDVWDELHGPGVWAEDERRSREKNKYQYREI
jgi:hypothetical protein